MSTMIQASAVLSVLQPYAIGIVSLVLLILAASMCIKRAQVQVTIPTDAAYRKPAARRGSTQHIMNLLPNSAPAHSNGFAGDDISSIDNNPATDASLKRSNKRKRSQSDLILCVFGPDHLLEIDGKPLDLNYKARDVNNVTLEYDSEKLLQSSSGYQNVSLRPSCEVLQHPSSGDNSATSSSVRTGPVLPDTWTTTRPLDLSLPIVATDSECSIVPHQTAWGKVRLSTLV